MHHQKYYATAMLLNTDFAPNVKLTMNSFPRGSSLKIPFPGFFPTSGHPETRNQSV